MIHGLPERPAVGLGQHTVETAQEIRDAGGELVDRRRHVERSQEVAQEPSGAAGRGMAHDAENDALARGLDLAGDEFQRAEQRHQAERITGDDVGAGDRRRGPARALAKLAHELAETTVDQAVGDQRRDDLAAQTMLLDPRPEALAQRPGST